MPEQTGITTYGVKEKNESQDPLDAKKEELALLGYTILESGIDLVLMQTLKEKLERIHFDQIVVAGGAEVIERMGETNTVRAPLLYDDCFLEVASNKDLMSLMKKCLGDFFILMQQNGIVVQPTVKQHTQGSFHRDLPYQHFVCSRPIAVNALLCLDDFSEENGGTVVIPGSHRMEAFPSAPAVRSLERSLVARAGQFVVIDSMLFHRAGSNRTDSPRRAVNNVYSLPFVRQQISLPDALGGRFSGDLGLRRLLGYETVAATNVQDWYAQRKARM